MEPSIQFQGFSSLSTWQETTAYVHMYVCTCVWLHLGQKRARVTGSYELGSDLDHLQEQQVLLMVEPSLQP